MLFVYPNLVSEMEKRGLDYRGLADILGIGEHAAYRRMRGMAGWKLSETIQLCRYFDVSDTAWLFARCDTYITKISKNQDGE